MSTLTRVWPLLGPLTVASAAQVSHPIWQAAHTFPSKMQQESAPIKTPQIEHPNSEPNPQISCTTSSFHVSETQIQPSPPATQHSRYL